MTIKGSLIGEHPRVKAVFSCKKKCSKSVRNMAVFGESKDFNIKYSQRDPQKASPISGKSYFV